MLACASGEQFACWPVSYGDNLHADLRNKGHIDTERKVGPLGPDWRFACATGRRRFGLFLLAREEGMGFAEAAEFAGVAPDRREVGRRAAAALRSRRALQMARLGRAVPREPPGGGHHRKGRSWSNARIEGFFGTLSRSSSTAGTGRGRPERLHGRAAPLAQVVPVGPRVGVARLEDATGTAGSWATRCRDVRENVRGPGTVAHATYQEPLARRGRPYLLLDLSVNTLFTDAVLAELFCSSEDAAQPDAVQSDDAQADDVQSGDAQSGDVQPGRHARPSAPICLRLKSACGAFTVVCFVVP